MKIIIIVLVLIAAVGAFVEVQNSCGSYDKIKSKLSDRYHEGLRSRLIESSLSVIEVYTQGIDEPWTILRVYPYGIACVIASGPIYQEFKLGPLGAPI